ARAVRRRRGGARVMAFERVADLDELWSGETKGVVVAGTRVVLVNLDGEVFAFEDRCAHLGVPLSHGFLDGGSLVCFAHQWEYDPRTGVAVNPRGACLRRFAVRVEEGAVWVSVDAGGEAP